MNSPLFKTVLVTGGCGYIGSALIRDLVTDPRLRGSTVRVLDNMQAARFEALMNLPSGGDFQFVEGDVLDPAAVRLALRGVDAVIHLAAVVRTPMSFQHPTWVEQVNHWGTARLVENCLEAGVTRFVYASSGSVYGPGGPFHEGSACRPLGAYAQSKRSAEVSILAAVSRGLRPVIVRLGTAYGLAPVTRFDAVVNRFAWLAGVRRTLPVFGSGEQIRPFIHVGDASSALRFALTHDELSGRILNAVTDNVSVLDIVAAVRACMPEATIHFTEQDVLHQPSIEIEAAALRDAGWQPSHSLRGGVAEIIGRFHGMGRMGFPGLDVD